LQGLPLQKAFTERLNRQQLHALFSGKREFRIMGEIASITMKDIARELNVSVATVSRALKNSPRISRQQRERIQAYANEHNFSPNLIAESLRNSRVRPMKIIGVIVPELTHFYFASVLAGIEGAAEKQGYRIMVAQSNEQHEREVSICKSFFENKVCGIIVSQAKDTTQYAHFQHLIDRGVPLVFYDRVCTGVNASRVVVDDYAGAYAAVSHLVETGCRRVACFNASMKLEISKNRYNGYCDALLKHGIKVDPSLVFQCDNRSDAERIAPEVLDRDDRPDAFFAVNDDTAIGILYSAKRKGFRIPEDISVCGFTNGQRAVACDPALTTVDQHGFKVGEAAAEILMRHVEGHIEKGKVERRLVRTRLVVRDSTRPVATSITEQLVRTLPKETNTAHNNGKDLDKQPQASEKSKAQQTA
jgi:transcriptional regulator, LacI family